MAVLLLNKHKDTLLDEEKAQKEAKQKAEEAQRAKDTAKQKEEAQKKAIEDDLKKAKTEEGSLFAGLDGDDDEEDC